MDTKQTINQTNLLLTDAILRKDQQQIALMRLKLKDLIEKYKICQTN